MAVGVLVGLGTAPFEPGVLEALRDERVHVIRRCVDVADLVATAALRQAEVAVVGMDLRGIDTDTVASLAGEQLAVVGVTQDQTSADEAVLRQMGAAFVCSADDPATVVDTVLAAGGSVEARTAGSVPRGDAAGSRQPNRSTGRTVAVWGSVGAPGRSVVTLGLGAELAALGEDVLVVDADVYGGSIAQMLGVLDESSGLLAAAREANAGQLTAASLARHCREIGPDLRILTGLPRADRWIEVKTALMRAVLATSRELVDVTVVDCGFCLELDEELSYDTAAPRRNGATIEILERADLVLAVGSADPVGLGRLIRGLAELREVVPSVEPLVVVNRVRSGLGWSRADIADTLLRAAGPRELAWLPDDPAACDRALSRGAILRDVAPSSRLAKALHQLAVDAGGVNTETEPVIHRFTTRRGARAR